MYRIVFILLCSLPLLAMQENIDPNSKDISYPKKKRKARRSKSKFPFKIITKKEIDPIREYKEKPIRRKYELEFEAPKATNKKKKPITLIYKNSAAILALKPNLVISSINANLC